jgi:hypothetical protein
MTAHYYEAVAEIPVDHCLHLQLPPDIPTGLVRVTITYERVNQSAGQDIKNLLAAMPNVGEDDDFSRHRDFGREMPEWDS